LLYLTANKLISFVKRAVSSTGVYKACLIKRMNQRLKFAVNFANLLLTVEVVIISSREAEPVLIKDSLTYDIEKI
jgi:hypothetical protein